MLTWPRRRKSGHLYGRLVCGVVVAVVSVVLAVLPGSAVAGPGCTDSWMGGSEGTWQTPGNWSTGSVPSATDVACIASGVTVQVTSGTNQAGVLLDEGTLVISGGSLELTSELSNSTASTVTFGYGTLTGAGTLEVSGSLSWTGGTMSGRGSTVVLPGASGSLTGGGYLEGRELVNEGTTTLGSGMVNMSAGAQIRNSGVFKTDPASSWDGFRFVPATGAEPSILNTGTFEKSAGSGETEVEVNFENEGTVSQHAGPLEFRQGTTTLADSSVLEGSISFAGASVVGDSFHGSGATVTLSSGTLSIESGKTGTVGGLTQTYGTLSGGGTLDVSGSMSWTGGTMSGAGSTVVQSGASGSMTGGGYLKGRELVNEGTTTLGSGMVNMSEGAQIRNSGVFATDPASSWDGFRFVPGTGAEPSILNTGTLEKSAGSGETEVEVNFENEGTISQRTGPLEFRQGITTLADGSVLEGSISLAGASVVGDSFHGSGATVVLSSGSLSIASGKTGTVGGLTQTGGTLTGAGALEVSASLSWTGGTMSGSGSTVVLSGASGSMTGGGYLAGRELVNEGTTTLWNGMLSMSAGAQIRNSGVFKTDTASSWDGFRFSPETGSAPSILNTGTFEKATGSEETEVEVNFENEGTISQRTGPLEFRQGTTTLADGSVLEGAISLAGASVVGDSFHGSGATIVLSSGTLSIESGKTGTVGGLTQTGGTLAGAGALEVSGSLSWTGGTMSGSGSTVVLSGASGSMTGGGYLVGRELVNEGTTTLWNGMLSMSAGAQIRNSGVFKTDTASSWDGFRFSPETGTAPSILNTGTFEKSAGSYETEVEVNFENEGTVNQHTGPLEFRRGTTTLADGSVLEGAISVTGASVVGDSFHGSGATVTLSSGSLSIASGHTGTVGDLKLASGTVTGAGTLDVSWLLSWTGGMMSGTGSTVVLSGASATLASGALLAEQRVLVNEGTATLNSGHVNTTGTGATPSVLNKGVFEKAEGSGEGEVYVNFTNDGRVVALAGELKFFDGGVPGQGAYGSWEDEGGSVVFASGTFTIVEETDLSSVKVEKSAAVVWIPRSLRGSLSTLPPDVSGTVDVSGSGEGGLSGPFAGVSIEVAPEGGSWEVPCGSLTPGLGGVFECSWDTAAGGYPEGGYLLRAKLSSESSPPETLTTPTVTVFVDNTPPTGSVTAPPSGGVGGFPTVMGTASDSGSGVASWQLQIAPEGSSEWASACAAQSAPVSGDEYGCIVETAHWSDGSYKLRALISDRAGNTYLTSTVGMHIDNAALSGSLDAVESVFAKTVEVEGTATSSGTGVASWALQIAPAGTNSWSSACAVQTVTLSGLTYGCALDTTTLTDGAYQLRALITSDEGSTRTTPAVSAVIDNTPPTGSLGALPASISGDYEVQGYAEDAGSGVASWTLQLAPVGSETWEEPCLPQTLPVFGVLYGCDVSTSGLENGEYKLRAVIVDNAGNTYTTATAEVSVENTAPSLTGAPVVSGAAVAGRTLSASTGSWSGAAPITYAYQWRRCNTAGEACTNIEGATSSTYTLASGDIGSTVRVVVTASNGAGGTSGTSSASAVIAADTLANISLPAVSGSPHAGATLNADPGGWSGSLPISFAYQWKRCNSSGAECANITGATSSSYTPGEGDISSTLRVAVTATNGEGSLSETSPASSSITAGAGAGIHYLYDHAGRLSIVDDPSKGAAVYEWDPDGNLLSIERYSASTLAVLALTPEHAPAGSTVDITGTGFDPEASHDEVSFDGTSATVTQASATDLIVTVPSGAGTGHVTVTVSEKSASSKGDFAPHARRLPGGTLSQPVSTRQAPVNPPADPQPQTSAGATAQPPAGTSGQTTAGSGITALPSSVPPKLRVAPRVEHKTRRASRRPRRRTHDARSHAHSAHHNRTHGTRQSRSAQRRSRRAYRGVAVGSGHGSSAPAWASSGGVASSTAGTAGLPAAVRDFTPSQPAAWDPTAVNLRDDDWVSGRGPSPWASLPALQEHGATTALSGQALVVNGMPLANVTLSLQGTNESTRTDSTGRFLLNRLPAGHQELIIDGESADHAGERYGQFTVGVELVKDKTTPLGYTIWMTPLDPAGNTKIQEPVKRETTLTNPTIPGLEVRLLAGTVVRSASGALVRKLNLTAIPLDRPPFPLPPFISGIPTYFTVQPGRAYLSKGAQIIYPNWGHLPAGQCVDFWNYDPGDKGWYIYGKGSVSANGKQVIPDPDVRVWEFTGAMISASGEPPASGPVSGASANAGDPVDLASGLFVYEHTDLQVPDSLMPIALTRTYRPRDNTSHSFGIGTTNSFEMHLWSTENYKSAELVLPNGGIIKLHRTSSGTGYAEAVYHTIETPGPWEGATLSWSTAEYGWILRRRDGMKFIFGVYAPLQAIEDRNGNRIKLVREGGDNGPIVQIQTPHGHWIDLSYDGSNRITQAVDSAGQTVKYEYNSAGLLVKVTDPLGRVTRYAYNSENDMTTVTDARGHVLISNEYEEGVVTKQILGGHDEYRFERERPDCGGFMFCTPNTTVWVATPTGVRRVGFDRETLWPVSESIEGSLSSGGKLTERRRYRRDSEGNITRINEDDTTTAYGEIGEGKSGSMGTTALTYDELGNVTSVTQEAGSPAALTTTLAYNSFSEPTSMTDPMGQTTTYAYDGDGNLTTVTDPMGRQSTLGYDTEGELTSVTDPEGNTSHFAYERGEQTKNTDPLGHETHIAYNSAGLPTSITDPEGNTTELAYNQDNELTSETNPAGEKTSYTYDNDGNLTAVTDPRGHTQTATYNNLDELTSWTDALSHTTSYTYDEAGRLTGVTDPEGKTTSYTYDPLNRLTSVSFGAVEGGSPTSTINYGYGLEGNLTSVDDSRAGTYTLSYDADHRLTGETGPNGSVGYAYNPGGQRTSMSIGGETAASYAYNNDGALTGIETPHGNVSFAYDPDGRTTQTTLPDGDLENYSYNAASELTGIDYQKSSGAQIGDLQYGRDALGRVSTLSGSLARTNLPEALGEATYNAANELTSLEGHTLTYDTNGNLTSNATSSYTYNDRNQLTSITQGSNTWSFAYDPFGRRTSKTLNGTETSYLDDGENIASETTSGSTALLLNGPGLDEHLARTTTAGTDSYLTDEQGSTLALAPSSGEPTTEYTYDPFGATTTSGATNTNPYQYTGLETEAGLQYNSARYYNPTTARFTSQDPLGMAGSGTNLYQYADSDPIDYIDPTGYSAIEDAATSFVAAVDSFTGGATTAVRGALGIGQPDFSSSAYQAGAGVGIVAAALTPGDEEAAGLDAVEDTADEAPILLRHYTDDDGADGIRATGTITPSTDGNTYLTPDQYADGPSARAGLNLNRTPTGYFEFPAPPGAPAPTSVAGGTGTEVPVPGPVSLPPGTPFNEF